jgi:hypothetical protein
VAQQVGDGPALGRYTPDDLGPTVQVRLVDAPVRVWKRSSEHHDELMREMALLALAPESTHDLPKRLVELVDVLGKRYGGSSSRPELQRDAALEAGLDRTDVVLEVPQSAGGAAAELGAMLEEVEEFCRTGDRLLTVAQPQVQAAFNSWYLAQVIDQCAGAEPTPWPGPWD